MRAIEGCLHLRVLYIGFIAGKHVQMRIESALPISCQIQLNGRLELAGYLGCSLSEWARSSLKEPDGHV